MLSYVPLAKGHEFTTLTSTKAIMDNGLEDILQAATRDQLSDCVRLLALNLVHHRVKFGFVPFVHSIQQICVSPEDSGATGLFVKEKQMLEEAFELVTSFRGTLLSESQTEKSSRPDFTEQRRQLRVNLLAPVKVQWPNESVPMEVELDNISWGGAAFHVAQPKGSPGDSLVIILPSSLHDSIKVEAKIVRTWDHPAGQGIATRFSMLSTRAEAELESILELLAESEDKQGQRKHARLTHRLEIQFDDAVELRATLEDISAGGLGITVPEPLELDQSFQVVISTLDDRLSFKLRARAIRQQLVSIGDTHIYHVGLEFEHPSEELWYRTNELIREMAAVNPAKSDKKDST
jgi:c-di-GMP-binding flagellar brake protein YcgR